MQRTRRLSFGSDMILRIFSAYDLHTGALAECETGSSMRVALRLSATFKCTSRLNMRNCNIGVTF